MTMVIVALGACTAEQTVEPSRGIEYPAKEILIYIAPGSVTRVVFPAKVFMGLHYGVYPATVELDENVMILTTIGSGVGPGYFGRDSWNVYTNGFPVRVRVLPADQDHPADDLVTISTEELDWPHNKAIDAPSDREHP